MKTHRILIAAAAAALAGAALANELPKEGSYDLTNCWSGQSQLVAVSRTQFATSYEFSGTTRSNTAGGAFDNNSFRCVGSTVSRDGVNQVLALCEAIDSAGDKRFNLFTTGADGKPVAQNLGGTGKYEGMQVSGAKVQPLGPFPPAKPGTFQGCNLQTGNYKLR